METPKKILRKKLIIFDLDGTLTESKADLKSDMAAILKKLLAQKRVAIIGGGKYEQFQNQFLKRLKAPAEILKNLFIFPTNSTLFYKYERGGWRKIYGNGLPKSSRGKIFRAFKSAFRDIGYDHPEKVYGEVIEDRGSQITFSALGQKAPLRFKERWNKESDVRPKLMRALKKYLSDFQIRRGGLTSIDVTEKGIDKAYGVRQIKRQLGLPIKDMLFVGDALYPGGNDYAAKKTGIDCIQVSGPWETKKLIGRIISR